jgi:hypothetical protein
MGRFPLDPFSRIFQPFRHSKSGGFHLVSLHKNRSKQTEVNMATTISASKVKIKATPLAITSTLPD